MDRYSSGFKYTGMLSAETKKPANSMNGTITTGVRVTASCLSEKIAEMIRAYPELAP